MSYIFSGKRFLPLGGCLFRAGGKSSAAGSRGGKQRLETDAPHTGRQWDLVVGFRLAPGLFLNSSTVASSE